MTAQNSEKPTSEQISAITAAVHQYIKEKWGITLMVRPVKKSTEMWTIVARIIN